tara:strand:- start:18935 stop:20158 length:1224 start_codon:yes stop_codon:yes gene_type:complete
MNPQVTSPVPAKDAMGMDYVPVYAEEGEGEGDVAGTVRINPVVQNNIGLRTAIATRESLSRTIRAVGRVDYDEEKIIRLHPKIDGWIRDIRVDKTGQFVQADQVLLEIYSPKLVATQQEYLLALQNYESLKDNQIEDIRQGASALVSSSRERLSLFDVPEHQIKALEASGTVTETLHIHSPVAGTVMQIGARQGQYVTPGSELYQIVDFSTVWVYADIYEYELPWVNEGDLVEMTLASLPGQVLTGTVSYIYPYAELKTRTIKVRIIFENPDLLLRPEMFADITIRSKTMPNVVVVPAEAIIRSGVYDQVFVMKEEGLFEPREVVLGIESGGKVTVLEGIQAGEKVVVSAQFLIDSESSLREATAKMTQMGQPDVPEHDQDHTPEVQEDKPKANSVEGAATGREGDH